MILSWVSLKKGGDTRKKGRASYGFQIGHFKTINQLKGQNFSIQITMKASLKFFRYRSNIA